MGAVAVTGLGVFCPDYTDPEKLFQGLFRGRSLLDRRVVGGKDSCVQTVCSAVDDDQIRTLEAINPDLQSPSLSKAAKMAVYAAGSAIKSAGLHDSVSGGSCNAGLFVGCNKNLLSPEHMLTLWRSAQSKDDDSGLLRRAVEDACTLRPDQAAEAVAGRYAFRGPVATYGDACAAGATAILSGYRRVLAGELDVAIVGASEHATQSIFQLLFAKLGALYRAERIDPASASRPFDKGRGGCLLADGAAFLVLESVHHAAYRNKTPLALLRGGYRSSEACRITATDPSGDLYADCIRKALAAASVDPDQIDNISAHGTATVSNDGAESRAIEQVFGSRPAVTATKSALGHSMAASGAMEAVLSVISLMHQRVLPTLNYTEPSPGEPHLNIATEGMERPLNYILSNSFGFGGENAGLVFAAVK